jgi:hypothetical protein
LKVISRENDRMKSHWSAEQLTDQTTDWRRLLILIALAMALIALAIAEVTATDMSHTTPWTSYIQSAAEALAKQNLMTAERAWNEGYVAALKSRQWQGLVEIGHAALRIGKMNGTEKASVAKARTSYLIALFLARHEGSVEGVLGVADAFDALGDREVTDQCARIAERLAAQSRDANARNQVRAFQERLAARAREPERRHPLSQR